MMISLSGALNCIHNEIMVCKQQKRRNTTTNLFLGEHLATESHYTREETEEDVSVETALVRLVQYQYTVLAQRQVRLDFLSRASVK